MARNTQVPYSRRRTVTQTETNLSFQADAETTVTIGNLKQIDGPEDVTVEGQGTGDSDAGEGMVVVCTGVGTDANDVPQVTLHAYDSGGTDSTLNDYQSSDIDHVRIQATGL
jgi:hypothetical protein